MKCENIEKLIYLNNELNSEEKTVLKSHLAVCRNCRDLFDEYSETSEIINKLSMIDIGLSDQNEIAERVINSINTEPLRYYPPVSLLDRMIQILLAPQVRFVLGSILIVLTGLFIFTSVKDYNSIKDLEQKYNQEIYSAAGLDNLIITQREIFETVSGLYNFVSGEDNYADLSDDVIIIKKSTLNELVKIYFEYGSASLINIEKQEFGNEFSFRDGINKRELELIFKSNEHVLEELEKLEKLNMGN
ncbi:MAG: hypothetical protein K9J16_18355 [Melioribacteraceae bacterium]|nr:hypothetical protein [Melioribacteraceae bacterium]MCF8356843.1 hypothetical protein [Melioribacteraceae bacterium]MCF8396222.1 hypothetical protein [Melioribacteraceae bacterium]MCF8421145.1 hypothetical protein [Melioribacteraceae bacterium]